MVTTSVKSYTAPDVDVREVLRYCRARSADDGLNALIEACVQEAKDVLSYKVCYCTLPVSVGETNVDFGFAVADSADLAACLKGMTEAVIFCATVGMGIDRLTNKYAALSPSRALVFQALGTERVEALANAFCEDIKADFCKSSPRFSPGYGDLSVEFQRTIFQELSITKNLGVTLSDGIMMSPTKSVTAIVGVR